MCSIIVLVLLITRQEILYKIILILKYNFTINLLSLGVLEIIFGYEYPIGQDYLVNITPVYSAANPKLIITYDSTGSDNTKIRVRLFNLNGDKSEGNFMFSVL